MTDVIFSFVMGLVIATFGVYGRVSSRLAPDNPYYRRRHPERAARDPRPVAAAAGHPRRLPAAATGRGAHRGRLPG